MTDELIIWGAPPPRRPRWVDRLGPFMNRPDEWGQIAGDFDRRAIKDLRSGRHPIPSGLWEFDCRVASIPGGRRIHIWARYLGPEEG